MGSDKRRYESWEAAHDPDSPVMPAATVVVVRDQLVGGGESAGGAGQMEVLMLKRAAQLKFGGGTWVFPGGKVDDIDRQDAQAGAVAQAARRPPDFLSDFSPDAARNYLASQLAGVREVKEETDLDIDPAELVCLSHWVPPPIAPKRYATWFFVAVAPPRCDVMVDNSEIVDYRWFTPEQALKLRDRGELDMLPPTFVTLTELSACASADQIFKLAQSRRPPFFATRIASLGDAAVSLWEGDAGYESGDAQADGPRHRLVMSDKNWRYQRSLD